MRSEIDDEETARIVLTVQDKQYVVCSAEDYIMGRENMLLDSYNIIMLYDEVVRLVFDMVNNGAVACINFVDLQERVLDDGMWDSWKKNGYVTDDLVRAEKCKEKDSVSAEKKPTEFVR